MEQSVQSKGGQIYDPNVSYSVSIDRAVAQHYNVFNRKEDSS